MHKYTRACDKTGVNFIIFFAPYALAPNFCASKKLLKKLGIGVGQMIRALCPTFMKLTLGLPVWGPFHKTYNILNANFSFLNAKL